MNRSGPSLATVRSPISRPLGLSMGDERDPARIGQAAGEQPVEPGLGARARDLVLAVVRDLEDAHARAHRPALPADRLMGIGAAKRRHLVRLFALGREPERMLEPERGAEHRASLL